MNNTGKDIENEKRAIKNLAKNIWDMFHRPILGKSRKKDKNQAVIAQRYRDILNTDEVIEIVSEFEVLQFLLDASLKAPLKWKWVRIIFHLYHKFYPDEDFISQHYYTLNVNDAEELLKVRRWLYKGVKKFIS